MRRAVRGRIVSVRGASPNSSSVVSRRAVASDASIVPGGNVWGDVT